MSFGVSQIPSKIYRHKYLGSKYAIVSIMLSFPKMTLFYFCFIKSISKSKMDILILSILVILVRAGGLHKTEKVEKTKKKPVTRPWRVKPLNPSGRGWSRDASVTRQWRVSDATTNLSADIFGRKKVCVSAAVERWWPFLSIVPNAELDERK